jgi:hypothetical protein
MTDVQTKLADEMEIRNLVARLAHLADRAPTLDEYLPCFTADAVWEYSTGAPSGHPHGRSGRFAGRAEIEQDRRRLRAENFQGPGSKTFHVNTTLAVQVHDDGTAEAQSYWLFVDGKGEPQIRRIGHYHDHFRRTPEGWRLTHRIVSPADA